MKDELVSFEVAELAKKKGFDGLVRDAYYYNSPELSKLMREECWDGYPVNSEDEAYLAAPTQSLLQRWLRERFFIDIFLYKSSNNYYYKIEYNKGFIKTSDTSFGTYEQALEEGLKSALQLIK
jgi:hypothetical protein